MADFQDKICQSCPYLNQNHLIGTYYFQERNTPLKIDEGVNSKTLIVLQSPGQVEWNKGKPLQSTHKGSAGTQIHNSWKRKNKSRENYDITNAVQCYQGKGSNGRDKKPQALARHLCYQWLKEDIKKKEYQRIIAFGNIAIEQVKKAISELNLKTEIKHLPHPTGGLTNEKLDSIW